MRLSQPTGEDSDLMECHSASSDSEVLPEHRQPAAPTRCVQGSCPSALSLLPHVPPEVTVLVVRRLDIWNFCLALKLTKFMVHFDEEISDFRYRRGRFSPTEISAYFWEF
jgi:hypothetical protein